MNRKVQRDSKLKSWQKEMTQYPPAQIVFPTNVNVPAPGVSMANCQWGVLRGAWIPAPAKKLSQNVHSETREMGTTGVWIPACAGMTGGWKSVLRWFPRRRAWEIKCKVNRVCRTGLAPTRSGYGPKDLGGPAKARLGLHSGLWCKMAAAMEQYSRWR